MIRATRPSPFASWFGVIVALLGVLAFAPAARAAEIQVRAEPSATRVYVGEAFKLQIAVNGSRAAQRPDLPPIPGIEARFEGGQDVSRSSVFIVNGRRTEERFEGYVFQFELVAISPGDVTIPSIEVIVDAKPYRTEPAVVRVVPPGEDRDVKLLLEVDNPSPYVGEPIRLRVVLGLARNASRPSFTIPGVESKFELVDVPQPAQQWRDDTVFELLGAQVLAQQAQRSFEGQPMASFAAERVVIPREAGRQTIGPATVDCEIILKQAMSVFDRPQTRRAVVPSNPLSIEVRPLPTEGRPANFNGLIGQYAIAASASPTEVNVGDPITVQIRVEGPLVSSVPAPALDRQENLVEGFRVASAADPGQIDGSSKIFTRVIRAQSPSVTEIPAIELPYFDSKQGRYAIARSKPIPIKVRETRVVTAADGEAAPGAQGVSAGLEVEDRAGGLRFNYEGPVVIRGVGFDFGLALGSPLGLAAVAGPPAACAIAAGLVFARRRSLVSAPAQRRRRALAEARSALHSAGAAEASGVPAAVSAAVRGYVAAKLGRAGATLTTRECVEEISRRSPDHAGPLADLLDRCDAAVYGGMAVAEAQRLPAEALELLERLDTGFGGAR